MKRMISATIRFYRKNALTDSHVLKESYTAKPGDIYHEFIEMWEKPRGDEETKQTRRVSQRATGKKFSFVRVVSKGPTPKGCITLFRPDDFSAIILREIK